MWNYGGVDDLEAADLGGSRWKSSPSSDLFSSVSGGVVVAASAFFRLSSFMKDACIEEEKEAAPSTGGWYGRALTVPMPVTCSVNS